ncbi:uncharacterized protein LOC126734554 isoform X2 [Anthonomus grandis grandis]|uniref:uncharacterized protein LOC126734554 isoform X2 n=1 Tax=Anthonomus grandis grandis TaxID=2921223 RepID=UPI0021660396|nr:uncharacterized protein LOC126734554 isoform X2 [Anthonomus grandis grandis]
MDKMFSRMENKGYHKETETGTELNKVTVNGHVKATTTCSPEVCRSARQRFQPPDLSGNPWNQKKTIFFITVIVLLIVWIIVYTIVSELKMV